MGPAWVGPEMKKAPASDNAGPSFYLSLQGQFAHRRR
jgi:hypothetical protein